MKTSELKILIVEDDAFQRQMLTKMLKTINVKHVIDVADGKQALDIIRSEQTTPIDIVISDLNMPEMDGLEFLRHLGNEEHPVAIVIISALGSKLLVSAGKMAIMYGISLLGAIEKPVKLGQLKDILSRYSHPKRSKSTANVKPSFSVEEIQKAVALKQIEPYFHPKIDFKTGRLIGAEALSRWHHPELGLIKPDQFIPQLEENRCIDELSFLMLQKSAQASREMQRNSYLIKLSVNISLTSLTDTSLADKITQIIKDAGVKPQNFVLEITESAAMTDVAAALENLTRLCMNGFTLSIDDFGTGYSSMQQLTRIAFGELKIDQSFVRDFAENEALCVIVKSCIDMAHQLKVQCVAEGVETQQEWDKLKSMGCDIAQGKFIAKPLDLETFLDFQRIHSSAEHTMFESI